MDNTTRICIQKYIKYLFNGSVIHWFIAAFSQAKSALPKFVHSVFYISLLAVLHRHARPALFNLFAFC